jgi:hypothetical protein
VPEDHIAKALNVADQNVVRKYRLLEGICPEVADILKGILMPHRHRADRKFLAAVTAETIGRIVGAAPPIEAVELGRKPVALRRPFAPMRWMNVDPRFGASMNPTLTEAPTRERQGMGVTLVDHSELEIPVFWGAGDGLPHLGFYEPSLGSHIVNREYRELLLVRTIESPRLNL